MVYEQFLTTVKEHMECALGPGYELSLRKIPKNNGLVLDSLCIMKGDSNIAPAIYLNTCYEHFRAGMPLEDIVGELLFLYNSSRMPSGINLQSLASYSDVRNRIAFKLIHAEANRNLLKKTPHINWLDLALVFYVCISEDHSGVITALIHNEHLNIWNISPEDLREQAFSNTPKLLPPTLKSMASLLGNPEDETEDYEAAPFFILTNTSGVNGAGCLLYGDIIKNFAAMVGQDLIILPSSIHEVLLLPDTGDISYEEMGRLVTHINETEVPEVDRLSNEVYLYSKRLDSISMASDADKAVPCALPAGLVQVRS